ncbi:MAG: hypothetical protein DRP64_00120 [Verrucomicrobia bacterium]|nr:MAG: hypothetical protein DRP64_00120 [Verrucomicrobiota bacterium]
MAKAQEINYIKLLKWYRYNPDTGKLTFSPHHPRKMYKAGEEAGWVGSTGYRKFRLGPGIEIAVHRAAFIFMAGEDLMGRHVDHINGDKLDNRWINLREADATLNGLNRSREGLGTKTLPRNVYKETCSKTGRIFYRVRIQIGGKNYSFGTFGDATEAIAHRDKVIPKLLGEFHRD